MPWESTGWGESDFTSVIITANIPAKTNRESEPGPSNVRTTEQLISQQDQAFETSLKVDHEKWKLCFDGGAPHEFRKNWQVFQ